MTSDDVLWWPAMNACLNASSTVLLVVGWRRIRRGDVAGHKRAMLTAVGTSSAFLLSYLVFHALTGSTKYPEYGALRTLYLWILGTHTLLAVVTAVLVPWALRLALTGRLPQHRRLAQWTLPIWLYVSFTGVVVYLMLYPLRP
ncbi:MAG: DUF420 domain-containing protein [Planctomycetes bacterium]|nr:DUF420 domain-containing protein [Planctomycetota bacterium]